ncbi:MAG: 3-methyl-2-oxobutanoate hydroxymethyltransferase [Lentisphaeraceae bacterium]|nr:3-methyl-2-oxobutanoate hydroxymethyltransferase [Lentisphaeraceae bacterium]
MKRSTVRDIASRYKNGQKLVSLSLYDAWMARIADQLDVDILLVGDSLGMTVLGFDTTVPVTIEDCLRHTGAVVRGSKKALVVGDMPFATYQSSVEVALNNAARFMQEAGAHAVKLEGGTFMASTVETLVRSGIPVMGHIGILPQSVNIKGYKVVGRDSLEESQLLEDAKALEEAGAFAVVLEGIQADAARRVSESINIPTIGIGAGVGCSGQIQVAHDLLGLSGDFVPKHAKVFADISSHIESAFKSYSDEVKDGTFPAKENSFE